MNRLVAVFYRMVNEDSDSEAASQPTAVEPSALGSWWAWLVIFAATAAMATSAMLAPEEESVTSGGSDGEVSAAEDPTGLAILEFQGKNLVGISQLPVSDEVGVAIGELKASVAGGNSQTIGAVAALEHFIAASDDSRGDALAFLDEELSRKDSPAELLVAIRSAIADPARLRPEQWTEVETRMGWFGELLAASVGAPDEARAEGIRESGLKLVKRLLLGVVLLVVAGLFGAVLLFLAIYYKSHDRLKTALVPPMLGLARVMLESFAIYLGAMAAADMAVMALSSIEFANPMIERALGWLSLASLPLSIVAAFYWAAIRLPKCTSGIGFGGFCRSLGCHRGKGIFTEIGCGLLGYVAMLPVVALGLIGTVVMMVIVGLVSGNGADAAADPVPITHPIVEWIAQGGLGVILLAFFLAAVIAPLFEETMFRGAFHGALRGRWNFWGAAFLSGLVFAAVHPQGLMAIPALGAMGFGFAMIREWRGSLIAPMTAHALHNGMLVGVMWMAFGR